MRLAARLVVIVLFGLQPVTVAAQDGSTDRPSPTTAPVPLLWLRGPFGTVPTGGGGLLETYVRRAPLRLESGDPDLTIDAWRASFQRLDERSVPIELDGSGETGIASSGVTLAAPDEPGTYRLEVAADLATGAVTEAAWTLVVPDRPLPADGLIEVPAPDALLTSGAGTTAGWAGSGCYVYLCVDVGRLPPLGDVPHLDVTAGEALRMRLSDDSAIAAWKVTLYPIVSGLQPAMDEIGDEPDIPVDGFTLEAPFPGEWILQAELTYDRLRGWRHAFYRLTSHPA